MRIVVIIVMKMKDLFFVNNYRNGEEDVISSYIVIEDVQLLGKIKKDFYDIDIKHLCHNPLENFTRHFKNSFNINIKKEKIK